MAMLTQVVLKLCLSIAVTCDGAYYVLDAAEDFFDEPLDEKYWDGISFSCSQGTVADIFRHQIDVSFCRYCWSIICRIPT